jgi:hypothetical protein
MLLWCFIFFEFICVGAYFIYRYYSSFFEKCLYFDVPLKLVFLQSGELVSFRWFYDLLF